MSIKNPILILQVEKLLTDPKMEKHPLMEKGNIRLLAREISGKKLFAEVISKNAAGFITSARRQGLITHYELAWRKQDSWCCRKQFDLISGFTNSVLDFLAEWSRIAGYRSSFSIYHDPNDGFWVGNHPRVCSLLKGVFNERAPIPRYSFIWDVQNVIAYLSTLGMLEYLNDKMLTLKLTILIALAS